MWNLSLRTKIFFAMALIGFLMGTAFVTVDYRQRRMQLLVETQQFVRSVAGTSALALRGQDLDRIHTNADSKGEEYRHARAVLDKAREINHLHDQDLYMIRPLGDDCSKAEWLISLQSDRVIGDPYKVDDTDRAAILQACHGEPSSTGIYHDAYGSFISGFAPVLRDDGRTAAIVEVDVDIDEFIARARRELWMKAGISAAVFLVAMIPGLLLSRHITRGLDKLSNGLRRFRTGDLTVQVQLRDRLGGEDEVVRLGEAFNEMIVSLGEKLAMLPYVSRLTAEAVRRSRTDPSWLTGSEQEVVVLFADLRGFTSFSEHRDASQVVRELNQLLAVAADAVISCGGDVDKFVGDCIMAVFIDHMHEAHALGQQAEAHVGAEAAALECAEKMIQHVHRETRAHDWALAMGVGIHCGPVVVGSIGSEARRDFTAIGHTVNLASRLCGKAAGGQVLVSETFQAALPPDARAKFVQTEPLMLKNVSQMITTYAWDVEQPAGKRSG